MPKKRIAREDVLKSAYELVRRGEALNARSIAAELGCSTQPVYSCFKNMDELRAALAEEAKIQYRRYIDEYIARAGRTRYEAYGMGFVRFAIEERGLFRYIFLSEQKEPMPTLGDPFFEEDILEEMQTSLHISREKAVAFHGDMSAFSYGLATFLNTKAVVMSEEEISKAFKREFYALYAYYLPERPRLG